MPTLQRPARRRAPSLIGLALLAVVTAACLPPVSRGTNPPGPSAGDAGGPSAALPSAPSGPTPRPSFVPPTPTPAPTYAVYVVKSGDNLNSIAKQFGTSARSIAFWNRSTYPSLDPESAGYSPNLLKLGWTLSIIPNVILTDDEAPPLPTAS
jgi:hypothetical protein